jgi:hypothetical protein
VGVGQGRCLGCITYTSLPKPNTSLNNSTAANQPQGSCGRAIPGSTHHPPILFPPGTPPTCTRYPPADLTCRSRSMHTPSANAEFVCSLSACMHTRTPPPPAAAAAAAAAVGTGPAGQDQGREGPQTPAKGFLMILQKLALLPGQALCKLLHACCCLGASGVTCCEWCLMTACLLLACCNTHASVAKQPCCTSMQVVYPWLLAQPVSPSTTHQVGGQVLCYLPRHNGHDAGVWHRLQRVTAGDAQLTWCGGSSSSNQQQE